MAGVLKTARAGLNGWLYVAILTYRDNTMHVISFRNANGKEIRWHAREKG